MLGQRLVQEDLTAHRARRVSGAQAGRAGQCSRGWAARRAGAWPGTSASSSALICPSCETRGLIGPALDQ